MGVKTKSEKNKSIKVNMVLNAIKGLMGILFPLITFPYASRILGVDNIGKYNFSNSVISYFIILADLGISTYAIREGARVRENKVEISEFSSEVFSINVLSGIFSFGLFLVILFFVPKFQAYRVLLLILSFQILLKAFNVEWIYSIYEDYLYITIRSVFFQIVSLICLFALVKTENDIAIYTAINSVSSLAAYFVNYCYGRKYCNIKMKLNTKWKKHIKAILILFSMNLTVSIYVVSDITVLGFLCDDYTVGIYSVSTKVYGIVKTIISSILIVSIPRMSYLANKENKEEFVTVASDVYKTLLTVMLPSILGLILLRCEVIEIISSDKYLQAQTSLILLSIALFFCLGAWFWGQCVLVPLQKEAIVFKITVISAVINILLNLILIPIWRENAAAFTTIISEGFAYIFCRIYGRREVQLEKFGMITGKIVIGCIGIGILFILLRPWKDYFYLYIIGSILGSGFIYVILQIILKNEVVAEVIHNRKGKIHKL